jgi:predicted lipoprotein with Yx(FWY)xxD motif
MTSLARSNRHLALSLPIVALAGASILFAACGSSTKTSTNPATTPAPAAGGSTGSNASVTVDVANLPGVGRVLVNGNGRTLYVLASEKGGNVTCTSSGGCTTIWPPLLLPSGMSQGIAGSGVKSSLLGTVNAADGVRVTYAGWPLYTFTSDTGAGMTKGQAFTDSYGLWWTLSPSGSPIKTSASTGTTSPTTAPQSGGAGF